MWSIINNNELDDYFNQYPELNEHRDAFTLVDTNDKTMLPRFFYKNYPSNHIKQYDPVYTPQKIDFECNITPRPMQEKVLKIIENEFDQKGVVNGVIKASCGSGKTILAILIASFLKLKTLIVVDSTGLMNQWVQEIVRVTNIDPKDIGIIKQKLFPIGNEKIIVSTVQSLLRKFKKDPKAIYQKLKDLGIGLIFFDEVHKSSASEEYAKVSTLFSVKNIIGLSATPYKFAEQDILMKNVIGPLLYDGSYYEYMPDIKIIYYKSHLDKYRFILSKINDFIGRKAFYNKIICESQYYLKLFTKCIREDLKTEHKTIVICQTEKQIKAISDQLTKDNIPHREYYGKEREFEKTDNVLLVTYSFAGTGFDFKELSSLIYACPLSGKVSLIQTAGRILRACEGKKQPIIRYLVDLTFPSQSLSELNMAKKVFTNEFKDAKITEVDCEQQLKQ